MFRAGSSQRRRWPETNSREDVRTLPEQTRASSSAWIESIPKMVVSTRGDNPRIRTRQPQSLPGTAAGVPISTVTRLGDRPRRRSPYTRRATRCPNGATNLFVIRGSVPAKNKGPQREAGALCENDLRERWLPVASLPPQLLPEHVPE